MAAGQTVKVSSFGAWQVRVKSARQGRNPKTKEPATISERRVLVFRASQLLKKMVNGEKITDQDRNAQE
jgi:integration host factor subunit alpha